MFGRFHSMIVHPRVSTRDLFADTGEGIPMHVSGITWGKVTMEAVDAGHVTPEAVYLSQDGGWFDTSHFHPGESADAVYVERWTPVGRAFHGWVDAATRLLVQAG